MSYLSTRVAHPFDGGSCAHPSIVPTRGREKSPWLEDCNGSGFLVPEPFVHPFFCFLFIFPSSCFHFPSTSPRGRTTDRFRRVRRGKCSAPGGGLQGEDLRSASMVYFIYFVDFFRVLLFLRLVDLD